MNTNVALMSRKAPRIETETTRTARNQHSQSIVNDVRFRVLLTATERRLARLLLTWHDPLTGYLKFRTRVLNITDVLDVSEETVRRARKSLIRVGLIVSYVPGNGHIASTYVVARSWGEAEEAVALRESLGDDAPYFPELVDDTPSAVGKRYAPPVEVVEDQEPEQAAQEAEEATERYERKRRSRAVVGPVPPELPASTELVELREIAERKADAAFTENVTRGMAGVRAAWDEARASGAA